MVLALFLRIVEFSVSNQKNSLFVDRERKVESCSESTLYDLNPVFLTVLRVKRIKPGTTLICTPSLFPHGFEFPIYKQKTLTISFAPKCVSYLFVLSSVSVKATFITKAVCQENRLLLENVQGRDTELDM